MYFVQSKNCSNTPSLPGKQDEGAFSSLPCVKDGTRRRSHTITLFSTVGQDHIKKKGVYLTDKFDPDEDRLSSNRGSRFVPTRTETADGLESNGWSSDTRFPNLYRSICIFPICIVYRTLKTESKTKGPVMLSL